MKSIFLTGEALLLMLAAGYVVLETVVGSTVVFDRTDWAFSITYIVPA